MRAARWKPTVWSPQTVTGLTVGVLPITDPGQIGAVSVPEEHTSTPTTTDFAYQPANNPDQPYARQRYRARPNTGPNYYVLVPDRPATPNTVGAATHVHGTTGSPVVVGDIDEHGPLTASELAARDRTDTIQRVGWLDRLLGKRPVPSDAIGHREGTVRAVGTILPGGAGTGNVTTDLGIGNAFQVPDVRRIGQTVGVNPAGYPLSPVESSPSQWVTQTAALVGTVDVASTSMDRYRAGAAGPFDGRPARMSKVWYERPYDKFMAESFTGQKGITRAPRAAQPTRTRAEARSSNRGGANYVNPAPGMEAWSTQPNTDRQIPTPWDQTLVATERSAPARRRWRT